MNLLPQGLRKEIPGLYTQEKLGADAVAHAKYFTPDSNWTWYATEFDGKDTFFGLVDGFEKELGYFSLSELRQARGPLGLPVERDLYWTPKTLREIASGLFGVK
jgi:hypothetical protein